MSQTTQCQAVPAAVASIRLSRREYTNLLAQLEQAATPMKAFAAANRRTRQRIPFHREARCVIAPSLGRIDEPFVTRCRNISRRGIAFLHDEGIDPGTRCELSIVAADRIVHSATGVVVRSRLVAEAIFEIGVRFDRSVNLEVIHGSGGWMPTFGAPARWAV